MNKVLSFIEWVLNYNSKLEDSTVKNLHIQRVANFYNQPFTTDMLVNPTPLYTNKQFEVYKEEFAQAEQKRLFEGWERFVSDDEYGYEWKYKSLTVEADVYFLKGTMNPTLRFYCYDNDNGKEIFMTFKTLNDFITVCNLAGIELTWNPNNQKVKGLL